MDVAEAAVVLFVAEVLEPVVETARVLSVLLVGEAEAESVLTVLLSVAVESGEDEVETEAEEDVDFDVDE